jgi:hypothetical protein
MADGRRADEHQPGFGAGLGEGLVLAQEAVARVDGLRAGGRAASMMRCQRR